jgi:general secretion pathway protein I
VATDFTNPHRRARPQGHAGFTLLEVMIALAILGLMLTSLLSIVAGQYDSNVRARNLTVANTAARCKMSEVEEKLLKDGYPETDQHEDGACCDGENPAGMSCRWVVERVVLPDPPQSGGGDGGVGGASSAGGGGSGGFGALAALAGAAQNPGSLGDGGIGGLASMLSGGMGGGGGDPSAGGGGLPGGGVNGIAGMAMSIVYPQLKPLLEASIRRVTVNVVWNEGPNERTTTLVLFVTNPQKGLPPVLDPSMMGGDAGAAVPGAGGVGGASPAGGLGGMGLPTMGGGTPRMGGM